MLEWQETGHSLNKIANEIICFWQSLELKTEFFYIRQWSINFYARQNNLKGFSKYAIWQIFNPSAPKSFSGG